MLIRGLTRCFVNAILRTKGHDDELKAIENQSNKKRILLNHQIDIFNCTTQETNTIKGQLYQNAWRRTNPSAHSLDYQSKLLYRQIEHFNFVMGLQSD